MKIAESMHRPAMSQVVKETLFHDPFPESRRVRQNTMIDTATKLNTLVITRAGPGIWSKLARSDERSMLEDS